MNNQQFQVSERALAQGKFNNARHNLLLMIIFTLVNLLLLVLRSGYFMLFSATVPYYAVALGYTFGTNVLLTGGFVIAIVTLLVYFLCWLFSKKSYGWLVAALVFFIIDTICLILLALLMADISAILDLVFHVMILYYLITGVRYGAKLKDLPGENIYNQQQMYNNYTQM